MNRRVLVVEDHPLMRQALVAVVLALDRRSRERAGTDSDPGYEVVETGTLAASASALRGEKFDLILLDLMLPDADGMGALAFIRDHAMTTPLVVVSARTDRESVIQAIDGGAVGFIPKFYSGVQFEDALVFVLRGGIYVPPSIHGPARAVQPAALQAEAGDGRRVEYRISGLTPRENDVFRMLLDGLANKVIARELGIAEQTVKTHVSAILRSLNVSSRTQAVLAASRLSAIGAPGPRRAELDALPAYR
jgi:DNA-binding NarL/FixJ family response regulator